MRPGDVEPLGHCKSAAGTHLLQTGGVELRLIDDLYGHLEAKRVMLTSTVFRSFTLFHLAPSRLSVDSRGLD